MRVKLWLDSTSTALVFEDADAVFTKGGLLCIARGGWKTVKKFPLCRVHCVEHPYESKIKDVAQVGSKIDSALVQ